MRLFKRLLIIVILVATLMLGILFSVENATRVPVDLLFVKLENQYLAFWLLASFAAGGVLGMGVSLLAMARIKRRELSLRRKINRYEKAEAKQAITNRQ